MPGAFPGRSIVAGRARRLALVAAFAWLAGLATGGAEAADLVAFQAASAAPGTIIVRTAERRLYLVLTKGQALRYKVGVGRAGRQWAGTSTIDGKYIRPNWAPPDEIKRDRPGIPDVIPSGSPQNPMGAAAMTLSGGSYAIHGTNAPKSIGGFVSYGCIRMYNDDILDLFDRVALGSTVIVTP
ncbi:L,D-transpeptidase [Kaistia dalseonensis]|uniref:Lipoprotein-anchoring transpeptidase ErfK/SrfK n=1 Tax=Kaistia dalseonensis TaxID=410840 RepID=A0ABU0H8Z3_9HYPH|nr:L,D-transpeptidase [Kaistia dalseonensis]MCX5496175.1 L,D-transpeptidase [Kaistia dalseonensis]MDQ0438785.1 lipoprotein-anchoring transpeptidase ErfK/SrfK [Kaistia dalseonensis]